MDKYVDPVPGWFCVIGMLICLGAPAFVGIQCIGYLYDGVWPSVSVLDAIRYWFPYSEGVRWLYMPTEWLGVWKILNATPASVGILIVGVAVILASISAMLDA